MEFVHETRDAHSYKELEHSESGCSTIRELDAYLGKNAEGEDAAKKILGPLLKLDDNEIKTTSAGVNQVQVFSQHDSSGIFVEKKLGKSATFPCANNENISLKPFTGVEHSLTVLLEGSSNTDVQSNKNFDCASEKAKNAACQRSLSFPPTVNVVSALKGSREKQGQTSREKLTVKWAPDVYDPPVTSASHTVKGYQQRPKPKKDKHRKRHKNGKSNRGNASEKKHASRTTAADESPRPRLHASVADERLPPGSAMRCGVDLAEYAAHCQESQCGTSFFSGSLAKISSPVAEAS